jgi:hypothetical protein
MLYDLMKDPKENRNVAGEPEYAKIVENMKTSLAERIEQAKSANVGEPQNRK